MLFIFRAYFACFRGPKLKRVFVIFNRSIDSRHYVYYYIHILIPFPFKKRIYPLHTVVLPAVPIPLYSGTNARRQNYKTTAAAATPNN